MAHETVGSDPYFAKHTINLEAKEIFDICIVAKTEKFLCEWHLKVECLINGKNKIIRFPADRKHYFRTSGQPKAGFVEQWDWAWYDEAGPSFIEVSERNKELDSYTFTTPPSLEEEWLDSTENTLEGTKPEDDKPGYK